MKSLIIIFLIHKFLDTAAAADSSNDDNSSGLKTTTKILIAVVAIIGIFVIGTLIYCLRKAKPKKRKVRDIGGSGKPGSRDVKKQKLRSSTPSNTSKENIREPLMTSSTPDVRLTVTTNPSLIQPSGTTTPSRVPPQTPLTPPQPQHSAIPSATQTTLAKVTESLEDSISYPSRKSTTEIIVTPEVTESHRSRPHTNIEQRDSPPQSRSSSDLSSRFSLPPTIQPHGPQSEVYPEGSASIEGQLEQVTRSRDTSPYRQYHETFDIPIDPRLQTQSRGLDTSLFSDTSILQSESADDSGEIGPGQRQRTSMSHYPAQPPYDDPTIPSTPPERRGRPESVYSFDDNPGSTVPSGPRPLQRSSPGSSQRSRRGRDRRGGNR